jgi:ATP phosphoribosyltransferase
MTGPLVIAVPSKGRLQENAAAFFARAGMPLVQAGGARGYRATVAGVAGAEIAFLSAAEIASEIASGAVHLGVTGLDLVNETIAEPAARERLIHLVVPLGFGFADVVVAVPKAWIDVRSMDDLADVAADFRARHGRRLRVATKYVHLARGHFARHGVVDYRIVESLGATEGAPAAGSAELVVDITTTGSTLAANALKVIDDGVVLRSEAHLVAARGAEWTQAHLDAARAILDRVAAESRARAVKEVRTRLAEAAKAAKAAAAAFGCEAPHGADGRELVLHCPSERLYDCIVWLKAQGAATVTVASLGEIFEPRNPLIEALAAAVGR